MQANLSEQSWGHPHTAAAVELYLFGSHLLLIRTPYGVEAVSAAVEKHRGASPCAAAETRIDWADKPQRERTDVRSIIWALIVVNMALRHLHPITTRGIAGVEMRVLRPRRSGPS